MSKVEELAGLAHFQRETVKWKGSKRGFYEHWKAVCVGRGEGTDGITTVRDAFNMVLANGWDGKEPLKTEIVLTKEIEDLETNGTGTDIVLQGELLRADQELYTEEEARGKVRVINRTATNLAEHLLEFYERDGRAALGYKTWHECVVNEFSESLGVHSDRNFFYLINAGIVRSNLLIAAQEDETTLTKSDVNAFSNHALSAMKDLSPEGQAEVAVLVLANAEKHEKTKRPIVTEKGVRQVVKEYLAPTLTEQANKSAPETREMGGGGSNAVRGNFLDAGTTQENRAGASGIVALTLCEEDNAVVFNSETAECEFIAQDENGQTYTLSVPIVKLQETGEWWRTE